MDIGQLITIVRNDYLDDTTADFLWDEDFMFRSFTEAERQACNRQNVLFDDSLFLSLVDGQASYDLPQKVTKIEYIGVDGVVVQRQSKHEIERNNPSWRTLTGMHDKTLQYVMRGHKITFTPRADASTDATFIQESAPTSGMAIDDTWYDSINDFLYSYDGAAWNINANAVLWIANLEVFRQPNSSVTDETYVPEIPEEYHRDLIYWVLHEAYKKQDADTFNQDRSNFFLTKFTEVFGEYISTEVRLNQMQERSSMNLRPTAYTTKFTRTTSSDDW